MKKLIATFLFCLPLMAWADDADGKYLKGAVPEENGRVIFSQTFAVKNKAGLEIYDTMLAYVKQLMAAEGVLENTKILLDDPNAGNIVARFEEWMVFKNKPLNLDRTRVYFQLSVTCSEGKCHIELSNIRYLYDEEREGGGGGQRFKAEEWITDKYGLNKAQTKLARLSGKFRRKTIDLKNDIFDGARHAFGEKKVVSTGDVEILE